MKNTFKAFVIYEDKTCKITNMNFSELMEGNVLIKIHYTSFNYKDGLAILNKAPIVKRFPMIPGADFSGVVVKSSSKKFKKGDKVLCNGWGIGEKHFGGFSEYAQVKSDWLIHLPNNFSLQEAMIIGAAGYTAALCVQELIKKIKKPTTNNILVTGASGGVGCIAVNLLSNLNYKVVALTNKDEKFLTKLGATNIIKRDSFNYSKNPLSKQKWQGAIDTVGGEILSTILAETMYDGIVVSTGLAKSATLNTTVYPFILRNITLSGIDCVYASYTKRVNAWKFLEKYLDKRILKKIKISKSFNDLHDISNQILKGQIRGRTLIKVI